MQSRDIPMAGRIGVYLFTDDLRLHDNPALLQAADCCDQLIFLYCLDLNDSPGRYGFTHLGSHRLCFINECLADLSNRLKAYQQKLILQKKSVVSSLTGLIEKYSIYDVFLSRSSNAQLQASLSQFQQAFPTVTLHEIDNRSLLSKTQLPFELSANNFPKTFSQFHKMIGATQIFSPRLRPTELPPCPIDIVDAPIKLEQSDSVSSFKGGESEGLKRLDSYFGSRLPETYFQTRNNLDGWDDSTKLSPWLAMGCLSPRLIVHRLQSYQSIYGCSKSNGWILYELYWREYFHWYGLTYGEQLLEFGGIRDKKPLTSYYAERLVKWCEGNTPFPLVNACMKQLNQTGYMSNRGRQITASCLVNELSTDWRYGAAYFQKMLIDYDMASNWGNWQYIAGVGADPRGGRHFNLQKQTEIYDPQDQFIKKWTNDSDSTLPLDSVNMVDWPVSQ